MEFHAILRAAFAYADVYVVYDVCEKSLAFSEAEHFEAENWSPISTSPVLHYFILFILCWHEHLESNGADWLTQMHLQNEVSELVSIYKMEGKEWGYNLLENSFLRFSGNNCLTNIYHTVVALLNESSVVILIINQLIDST